MGIKEKINKLLNAKIGKIVVFIANIKASILFIFIIGLNSFSLLSIMIFSYKVFFYAIFNFTFVVLYLKKYKNKSERSRPRANVNNSFGDNAVNPHKKTNLYKTRLVSCIFGMIELLFYYVSSYFGDDIYLTLTNSFVFRKKYSLFTTELHIIFFETLLMLSISFFIGTIVYLLMNERKNVIDIICFKYFKF